MTTAHEMIRAYRLLPTEPFDLLFDPETENVIVPWSGLLPELSLMACVEDGELFGIHFGHHDKVMEYLGASRAAEIQSAVEALYADHHARVASVAEIYRVLEGADAD